MLFLASIQGKFPLSTQRALPVNTEITHFWPPSPSSKKWDKIILAEGLLDSTQEHGKSPESNGKGEGEQETDVSHAMLGFAWSQRNPVEWGMEHGDGTGREKGSCCQPLNCAQAAPGAAHQKV